ncbi:hypothetical protein HBI56_211050 [Parastagonospora nodorum]|uniref:C2H2-type domain-containing protein n=2 Tax=Phaeosphaeria nodorum (strain SN15 / ATCC MYA-4574 / FGSC 10173) TaxID=321614 RepID=A0A7U2F389_PHANO|nr:hypothetical protein HBH56_213320 [Parastagonospora nodorum]QRC97868.1 hypothetical protein JI435_152070 [Parastagonospora nodorum SN15]KAH3923122.1 hypothetical protein HBH54_214990 [Parastagonospora nodorum]KAH3941781.1 hypothetical protein HBH53_197100 [Parastagonospora nodorum]KAH3961002.1 hypothetical protein HBH51_186920 [Parastagonospora nodorum]
MATFQYRDLPQINMGESRFVGCGPDTFSYTNVYDQDNVSFAPEDNMYFGDLDNGLVGLQPVQRPFQYQYPPFHSMLQALPPVQRQIRIQYEPQWPSNDCLRTPSPDRTSASDCSTDASLSDIHSPYVYHAMPYAGPTEGYSPSLLPFPTTEHLKEGGYPTHPPLSGGSINLQMIEYEHPELESETVVDEVEHVDFKHEAVAAHEVTAVKVGSPASDLSTDYPDSGLGNSLRDAESVQPIDHTEIHDDPESDEDYSPKGIRSNKRKRSYSSSSGSTKASKRKDSSASTSSTSNRVSKRTRRASAPTKKQIKPDTDDRRFPCPLAPYGCDSTFSSKNEWKRHVSTQHIKLFYWRCDLCAPTTDAKNDQNLYFNDFNRKDLYTQHIRRMHAAPKGSVSHSEKDFPVTEENLQEHQSRCFTTLRQAPQHSCCLFCDKTFEGPASWEERMEHVGRHLEKDNKGTVGVQAWNPDSELERYLLDEGLIVRGEGEVWKIGDGKPLRRKREDDYGDEE